MSRRSIVVALALFAAGCASEGTAVGGGYYDGLIWDDPLYYWGGGWDIDDIGPPPPRPEHPIALPPDAGNRPTHPIATPPSRPTVTPMPRPAAMPRGGGGRR